MFGDTALIRLVIEGLVKNRKCSYAEALEKFYMSDTCRQLSDSHTGMFTFAPREIIEILEEETFISP